MNNYNTVPSSKARPDAAELLLAEIDSSAAMVIADVLSSGSLPFGDVDQMEVLLSFVAMQFMRVPAARTEHNLFIDEFAHDILAMYASSENRWTRICERARADGVDELPSYAEACRIVETRSVRFSSNNAWQLIRSSEMAAGIFPFLAQRNWFLARSDSGSFVCGDSPVSIVHTRQIRGRWSRPGFAVGHTEVAMPLSRHWVLCGQFERVPDSSVSFNPQQVAEINSRALWNAERFIWSAIKDFPWMSPEAEVKHGATGLKEVLATNV